MPVYNAYDPNHRNLVVINCNTGEIIKKVKHFNTERYFITVLFKNYYELEEFIRKNPCAKLMQTYPINDNGFIEKDFTYKELKVILKDDDPYDHIECPLGMDFKFFKEKVITAMKVARGLGKPIPIEKFYKYCKYPEINEKRYSLGY